MMEIGQGSSSAIQHTIASMGANNLLIMPGTAASGGVSFGAGTVLTLTPEDSEAIASQCSAVARRCAHRAGPHPGHLRQPQLGADLHLRDDARLSWTFANGRSWRKEMSFTDRDVRNASKVCVIGQTTGPRAVRGRIAHRQGDPGQERLLQGDRRPEPQGRQHDGHRPGRCLAGPVDDDQVPRDGVFSSEPQPERERDRRIRAGTSQQVNTLSQLYPNGRASSIPRRADSGHRNAAAGAVHQRRSDPVAARSRSRSRPPSQQITEMLRERHRIRRGEPDDFNIRDMTEMTKALATTTDMIASCCWSWPDLAGGRRRGDHEHHAGVGDGADARDRPAHGGRGAAPRTSCGSSWSRRSSCASGRACGIVLGRGVSHLITAVLQLADGVVAARDPRRRRRLGDGGHRLRLLPGVEGVAVGPDHRPAL